MNYKTVGLIGLCSGAGTTQLGIMLANYFSNGLHLKTAIVSAGFDDSFDRIKEEEQVGNLLLDDRKRCWSKYRRATTGF